MVFPLEQLVVFDGNIYEITVAASLRAYQMAKVNDPEIAANQDKVVCAAAKQLFTDCNLGVQDKMNHKPAFESGGAGLCSTADDYMKFALMLTQGGKLDGCRILSENTVRRLSDSRLMPDVQKTFDMKMPHLAGYSYCNLLRIAANPGSCNVFTNKGEFGWDGWLGPYVSVDREDGLTIVMTMQRCDSGTTSAARRTRNIIYSA